MGGTVPLQIRSVAVPFSHKDLLRVTLCIFHITADVTMLPTSLTRFVNRSLNIRTAEWPQLGLLVLMLFLAVVGNVWGRTIAYAALLDQVGIDALPVVLMVSAVLSFIVIAVYTAFADRITNERLLIAILLVTMAGVGSGRFLLAQGLETIAYPFLYLLFMVIIENTFFLHWWTYVNSYYDTRAAKRIVPIVATSARIASIVAGRTIRPLNQLYTPAQIVTFWLGLLAIVTLIAWLMPQKRKTGSAPPQITAGGKAQRSRYLHNLRQGYDYVVQSSYLRWLALATLTLMVLYPILNYQTSALLAVELNCSGEAGCTEAISNFVGELISNANLLLLPVQLFLLSRIIGRIGLGNANLIYPTGTLFIGVALVAVPGIPTAALAYLARTVFRTTFRNPTDSLLYNAVPLHVKGRARGFISGLIVPIGTFVGSGLVLLPLVRTPWFVPLLIVVLVVAYFASVLGVRRRYGQALVEMLEQEDYSFLLSQEATELTTADPATLKWLKQKLASSKSEEFTIFMARLISETGGGAAAPILEQIARDTSGHTRAIIIDMMIAADMRGDSVRQLFTGFLADESSEVRHSAVVGLKQWAGPADERFLAVALQLLSDPDIEVRAEVVPSLLHSPDARHQEAGQQAVEALLQSDTVEDRIYAIRALRQADDDRFVPPIIDSLNDPADEVRLEAAVALEALVPHHLRHMATGTLVRRMETLLQDPVERVRQAALAVLAHAGTHDSYQVMVKALRDGSSQVRTTAVETLAQIGKGIIPEVHPQLDAPDPQLRKMAAVVLSRVDRREFEPLIGAHVTGNLLAIYRNHNHLAALDALRGYATANILCSGLQEQNEALLDEIFYLLTTVHGNDDVHIIRESLQSETERVRANALEALESLTSAQTARLVAPLFSPEVETAALLSLSQETWDMVPLATSKALQQLLAENNDAWLRTIATHALGDIGVALVTGGGQKKEAPPGEPRGAASAETAVEKPPAKRKRRRRQITDLLDALADDAPPPSPPPPESAGDDPQPGVTETLYYPPPSVTKQLTLPKIISILQTPLNDSSESVQAAAQAAYQAISDPQQAQAKKEGIMLSDIERIIFLKEVPFFRGMTINQLKVLTRVCEEELFAAGTTICHEGEPGGVLYVIVRGRVAVEREGRRKGSVARLATIEAHSYFGEITLFDTGPRTASIVALQDTFTLKIRREPLIALARQYPDLSLELIDVLSQRLREINARVAELTRAQPRELHQLFDQLGD